MGKLTILGAQRVKALTQMLEVKEREAIQEKQREILPSKATEIVDEEFGVTQLRKDLEEKKRELRDILAQIQSITGEDMRINVNNYGNQRTSDWFLRVNKVKAEQARELNKIKEEFASKKQKLWLCETLEEAKEIVGID